MSCVHGHAERSQLHPGWPCNCCVVESHCLLQASYRALNKCGRLLQPARCTNLENFLAASLAHHDAEGALILRLLQQSTHNGILAP